MNETERPRSIGAVFAGIVAGVLLTLGTDVVLHAIRFFPRGASP